MPAEVFAARKTLGAGSASESVTAVFALLVLPHHLVSCQLCRAQGAAHRSRRRDPGSAAPRDCKESGRRQLCHDCHPLGIANLEPPRLHVYAEVRKLVESCTLHSDNYMARHGGSLLLWPITTRASNRFACNTARRTT